MLAILVYYHQSGYNRFVATMPDLLVPRQPLCKGVVAACKALPSLTPRRFRFVKTSASHGTKPSKGKPGAASLPQDGFKLHLVVDDQGEILSFWVTPGNVDDRKPVPERVKSPAGKLFGDRGYISRKPDKLLAERGIKRVTALLINMKVQYIDAFDKLLLCKRSIIETINDPLKTSSTLSIPVTALCSIIWLMSWPVGSLTRTRKKSLPLI